MKVRMLMAASAVIAGVTMAEPMDVQAQVAGTWELSAEGPRGAQTMVLVLDQAGVAPVVQPRLQAQVARQNQNLKKRTMALLWVVASLVV